jgi:poly-gamma-glutamate capsule biosynthesis protein CapA/YwtB (metallophosphatase superfamily)
MEKISLIFGGDIGPLRSEVTNMFGELTPIIKGADIAVANLEFALIDGGQPVRGKIYPHKAPTSILPALADAGFDAFNLANNHMLDYGPEALVNTLDLLDGAGIGRFGAGYDLGEASKPLIIERQGLRVGLLGATSTLPIGFSATEALPGVNPLKVITRYRHFRNPEEYPGTSLLVETEPMADDLERICADVQFLASKVDLVLVYQHWGESMNELVHSFQRAIAHAVIDVGAAGVFGGHQHVISAVEFYRGVPIIHGMGNLVFDFAAPFFTPKTRQTVVFSAKASRSGLSDCHLIACGTGVDGPVTILHPDHGEGGEILTNLRRLSEPLGCELTANDDRIRLTPL